MNKGCRIDGIGFFKTNPARLVGEHERHLVQLYFQCTNEWGVVSRYPDGDAVLDQPVKLTRAFAVISREVARFRKGR